MTFARLLAKSRQTEGVTLDSETLSGHTRNVASTSAALIDTIGETALRSLGLTDAVDIKTLRAALLRAAALHDLGKANTEFQLAVRPPHPRQSLRHEYISTWLVLHSQELGDWLFAGCAPVVRSAALCGVLGHHLKMDDAADIKARPSGNTSIEVLLGHAGFSTCLDATAELLALPAAPALHHVTVDLCNRPLSELQSWLGVGEWWADRATDDEKRFVALVKALLISADVGGSAVPRDGTDPAAWTRDVVTRSCTPEMLAEIVKKDLDGHEPRLFQSRVAESPARVTFVRAGCGSGKTAAAYMWAQRNAADRKLFFCYPTTGTTTEGFRSRIEDTEAVAGSQIQHGRAAADIELLLKRQTADALKRAKQHGRAAADIELRLEDRTADALERAKRYESLSTWHVPITLCTVDYVLGLIQNYRSALFSFPGIASAAFVFDEVHQYDNRLFGELLRFIGAFRGAPILLMTATLPGPRLEALRLAARETGTQLRVVDGPAGLEDLKRYEVADVADEPPWSEVDATLARTGKVLWVANKVDRAVAFAQAAANRNAIIYHSRYRYMDRLAKHKAVMDAFNDKKPGPALAITTQVCEVSLDISAELLVTDMAPIPALIQRMGRLNRRATEEKRKPGCRAIFLRPNNHRPYDKADFDLAEPWVSQLARRPVSQRDLAEAFAQLDVGEQPQPVASAWLDGGPLACQTLAREAESSVQVIRHEDKPACVTDRGKPNIKEITKYATPMLLGPVAGEIGSWQQLGPAFIAPPGRLEYSTEWGGKWARSK